MYNPAKITLALIFAIAIMSLTANVFASDQKGPVIVNVGKTVTFSCGGAKITDVLANEAKYRQEGYKFKFTGKNSERVTLSYKKTKNKNDTVPDTLFFYCTAPKGETQIYGITIWPLGKSKIAGPPKRHIDVAKEGFTSKVASITMKPKDTPVEQLTEVSLSTTDINVVTCAGSVPGKFSTNGIINNYRIFKVIPINRTYAIKFNSEHPELFKEVETKIDCSGSTQSTDDDLTRVRFVPKRIPGQFIELSPEWVVNSDSTTFSCNDGKVTDVVISNPDFKHNFDEGKLKIVFPATAENKPSKVFIGCAGQSDEKVRRYDVTVVPQKGSTRTEIKADVVGKIIQQIIHLGESKK